MYYDFNQKRLYLVTFLYVIVISCFAANASSDVQANQTLKISVYYETLCPDSIRFIKNQLYPVYQKIPSYLQLDFVPYGIATTITAPNGTHEFTCQHGVGECLGNTVHSCAIKTLKPSDTAAFVNCTMSQKNPPLAGQFCSDLLNLEYSPIESCADGTEGNELLYQNGLRTQKLDPKLYWVPWITYNDIFYEEDLDPSQANLLPVVCKHINGTKPEVCNEVIKSSNIL